MTIDELLTLAQKNINFAIQTTTMPQDERAVCASVAQAAAATAQAMILAQMTDVIERPGMSDRRILNVDTGN